MMRFNTIANTAHKPTPAKLKLPIFTNIPPTPVVNTVLTMTKFFGFIKSTLASIRVFKPKDAIVPNNKT